jgi:hypothetical protein
MTAVSNTSQGRPNTNHSEDSKPLRTAQLLNPVRRIWKKTKEADKAQEASSVPLTLATVRPDEQEYVEAFSVPLQTIVVPRSQYTYYNPPRDENHTIGDTTQNSPEQYTGTLTGTNIPISPRRSSLAIESTPSATNNPTNVHPTPTTGLRPKRRLSIVFESVLEYESKPSRAGRYLAIPASNAVDRMQRGIRKPRYSSALQRSPFTAPDKAEQTRLAKAVRKRPIRRAPIPENWQELAELHRLKELFFKRMKGRTPLPEEWKIETSNDANGEDDKGSVNSFVTVMSAHDEKAGEIEEKRIDSAAWDAAAAAQQSSKGDTAAPQITCPTPVRSAVTAHAIAFFERQRLAPNPILLSRKAFTIPCAWLSRARTRRVAWNRVSSRGRIH